MTYRVAADVMAQMFPVDAGNDPETLRCHTLTIGADLRDQAAVRSDTAAPAIAVTLDSTFIRSCEEGERHLEVRVGNVETASGGRQVFGAVAKADTDIKMLIRRSLDAVGRSEDTVLTAFTDGCSGLRRSLAEAGVTDLPQAKITFGRVGGDVAIPTPHRPGRAGFPHPVLHARASLAAA
jgi:hypothetical protein